MFYAAAHHDGIEIAEGSTILAFMTRDEAERYLVAGIDPRDLAELGQPSFVGGEFGDAWKKMFRRPVDDCDVEPFQLGDVIIRSPGQHPGLPDQYWITPRQEVLVVVYDTATVAQLGGCHDRQ